MGEKRNVVLFPGNLSELNEVSKCRTKYAMIPDEKSNYIRRSHDYPNIIQMEDAFREYLITDGYDGLIHYTIISEVRHTDLTETYYIGQGIPVAKVV